MVITPETTAATAAYVGSNGNVAGVEVVEVYKLMRLRRDGTLGSLFINPKAVIPLNQWLKAESYPTSGFAIRPGWHVTRQPVAPHLSMKGRVWVKATVRGVREFKRPECQGGVWLLAEWMRVDEILSTAVLQYIQQQKPGWKALAQQMELADL